MEVPSSGRAAANSNQLTRSTGEETTAARRAPARVWILIALGVGCLLFGGLFFAIKNSGHNVVATITHQGPCSNSADVCTVRLESRSIQPTDARISM